MDSGAGPGGAVAADARQFEAVPMQMKREIEAVRRGTAERISAMVEMKQSGRLGDGRSFRR
jgi:hypothetical protein